MFWLLNNGWTPVTNGLNRTGNRAWPDEVGVDEGGDGVGPGVAINNWSSVYVKRIPAGTFSILQADNAGQNMYGVVIARIPPPGLQFTSATVSGATLTIDWSGAGRLQQASILTGSNNDWSDVPNPPKPYTVPVGTSSQKFYRLINP